MESIKSWFASPATRNKIQTKLETRYGLVAGSTTREDGKVQAGWVTLQGKRPGQEDSVFCKFEEHDSCSTVGCFGVFDGHGGPDASRFVRDNLYEILLNHPDFKENPFKAVEEAFVETDRRYLEVANKHNHDDGTTALVAVLVGQRLILAHVGDSRAVLGFQKRAVPLSRDHKPNRSDEKIRIERTGGSVTYSGTWRVEGVLAVSRSFGNRYLKEFVIPYPEIREDVLDADNTVLVLGSDGLWDVMTNQEAVKLACKHPDAEIAARVLAAEAYLRGSQDNISVIVCHFKFPAGPGRTQSM